MLHRTFKVRRWDEGVATGQIRNCCGFDSRFQGETLGWRRSHEPRAASHISSSLDVPITPTRQPTMGLAVETCNPRRDAAKATDSPRGTATSTLGDSYSRYSRYSTHHEHARQTGHNRTEISRRVPIYRARGHLCYTAEKKGTIRGDSTWERSYVSSVRRKRTSSFSAR